MDEFNAPPPPPPGPPPLLSEDQLVHLVRQGWLCVTLPDTLSHSIDELRHTSREFFDRPSEEKARLYPSKQGTEFGYYPVQDEKEYITFRCHVHAGPGSASPQAEASSSLVETLEARTARAWRAAALFLFRILCDIGRASGLGHDLWRDILDGTLTMPDNEDQVTYTLMRLFRYFPTTGFAGEHADLGLLTLCVGDGQGLQVVDRAKSTTDHPMWIDAPAGITRGTVLIGQTLRALSSGTLHAGAHRVVGNPNGRSSVVFALRHSARHDIDFGLFGAQGKLTPLGLWKAVQAGKVNVNSVKEKRDLQRARLKAAAATSGAEDKGESTMGQG